MSLYKGELVTHWGWVTHICNHKITIIGSENGLSPDRCQATVLTSTAILLIGPLRTIFSEISTENHRFSSKKMDLKMSSAKCRPFCGGLLRWYQNNQQYPPKPKHQYFVLKNVFCSDLVLGKMLRIQRDAMIFQEWIDLNVISWGITCRLVVIAGTINLVPSLYWQTTSQINKSDRLRWNRRVPDLQMSCENSALYKLIKIPSTFILPM